ncbi:beta-lactamase family protein [Streptomyces sp. PKU-MA01144]|uniref:serine hydrolase domain-containing protein n=1 Tax=Streptomyces sp. PKU-MA01144 TaxID=2729138 RepID=UPI00147EDDF3|nr:serine hydrolase domain-containing protein [Streptomyces sp. PKU-MA01144]NNJ08210.1 beta-lactamase family protein [Streptomyces sp. PKU-MA01144]
MEAYFAVDRLRELAQDHSVPGAQMTIRRAGETLSVTTGVRRAGSTTPVTADTAFALGSVTKVFTATVIAQLVAEGDLEWDEPVADYLAEFDGAVDGRMSAVTLRHLLSHTAGLVADHELDDAGASSLARYTASVTTTRTLHAPGHCFSYSNTGYNVLGRVIEATADMKWQAVMENSLLRPLGIDPVFPGGGTAAGLRAVADGHAVRPGRERAAHPVGLHLPAGWAPAGGLAGSADDLVALATLHLGTRPGADTLLPAAERAEMSAAAPAADAFGMADGWGLGLAHYASPVGPWLGHDGTADGASAHLRFHPATGTAVALTANATTGTRLWADLVDALREHGVPVGDHRPAASTAPAVTTGLDRFAGDYRNGDTRFAVRAHREGTALRLTDATGLTADLTLHGDLAFTARRTDTDTAPYTGRFVTDPATGDVTLMQLGGRSARRTTAA